MEIPWKLDKGDAVNLQDLSLALRRLDHLCPPYIELSAPRQMAEFLRASVGHVTLKSMA